MASGDLLTHVRPAEFTPDNGPQTGFSRIRPAGALVGLPLGKEDGLSFLFQIPVNGTPLSTGLTVELTWVDDPINPQAGGVINLGVEIIPITSGTTTDVDPAYGTNEVQATATIPATAAAFLSTSVAVANAKLSSAAAGNFVLVHIRRAGVYNATGAAASASSDTHAGRPYLLGVVVKDT